MYEEGLGMHFSYRHSYFCSCLVINIIIYCLEILNIPKAINCASTAINTYYCIQGGVHMDMLGLHGVLAELHLINCKEIEEQNAPVDQHAIQIETMVAKSARGLANHDHKTDQDHPNYRRHRSSLYDITRVWYSFFVPLCLSFLKMLFLGVKYRRMQYNCADFWCPQAFLEPSVKGIMERYCVREERNAELQSAERLHLCSMDSMSNIAKLLLHMIAYKVQNLVERNVFLDRRAHTGASSLLIML